MIDPSASVPDLVPADRQPWPYYAIAGGAALLAGLMVAQLLCMPTTLLGLRVAMGGLAAAYLLMGLGRLLAPDGGKLATIGCLGVGASAFAIAAGEMSPPVLIALVLSVLPFAIGHVIARGPFSVRFLLIPAGVLFTANPVAGTLVLAAIWGHTAVWMMLRARRA